MHKNVVCDGPLGVGAAEVCSHWQSELIACGVGHMRLGKLKREIAYKELPTDQSICNPPAINQIDFFIIQNHPRLWITAVF